MLTSSERLLRCVIQLMPTSAPLNIPLSEKAFENYIQFFESAVKYGGY